MLDFLFKKDTVNVCENLNNFYSKLREMNSFESISEERKEYLKSTQEYQVRFAIVMLLNYYINDQYIDQVLQILDNVKLDKYYVQMANAWAISICLIKYYNKTLDFLNTTKIDDFTYNKGIQKAIESYRITNEQKEYLRTLKRRR